uniref:B box-type domain-containing protein n=1 Tax=Periophthalmus magnuspinnatus TaxID=409849 RepID=A0A3B4APB3_9GOBI
TSTTSSVLSEETFLCSICLEVFSEPVWDTDGPCTCPLCKKVFYSRPQLKVNTLLKEVASGFNLEKNRSRSMDEIPDFKEVQCDVCSEPKLKALKSCLVCLCSFCESHLQPHLTVSGLKRHQLIQPVEHLEDRICPTHQRPLELFCATNEKSICVICSILQHKNHEFFSLEEECEHRRSSLLQTQAQSQHMVEQRRQKIQEIQILLELSETEALRERAVGLQAFTALMQSVQSRMDLFLEELQEKQMAQESINRKGKITLSPEHGLWCIHLRNKDEYKAWSSPLVPLSPQRAPEKVGVFVDYGKGLVSFYDAHSADLLYCCFHFLVPVTTLQDQSLLLWSSLQWRL